QATAFWAESMAISRRLGDKEGIAYCLEGFAALAAPVSQEQSGGNVAAAEGPHRSGHRRDRARRAARLLGAAAALRELGGSAVAPRRRAEHERQFAAVRAM